MMLTSVFQEVRDRVSLEDFARDNGFPPNRAGFCSCPLHIDKTPSLKIYASEQRWRCFSCEEYGDVTDLARKVWGCSAFEAVIRLDAEYHLGLDFKGSRQRKQTRKSKTISFDLKAWQRNADSAIAEIIDILWNTIQAGERVGADKRLINALWEEIDSLEELHDNMLRLTPAEQFKQYKEVIKEVEHAREQHRQELREWFSKYPF